MRVRLAALSAAAITGLLGSGVIPAAAADETAAGPSDAPAATAATTAAAEPTAATGGNEAAPSTAPGPAEAPSSAQAPANEPTEPTGRPDQEAGSAADASIGNDAAIDQASGQGQDAGTAPAAGSGGSAPAAAGNATPQRDQEAHTGQQVGAQAGSSANGPKNESQGVRVGQAGAGDGGGVGQANTSTADAGASATQGTAQTASPGSGSSQATGDQSASADANATADRPENSIVNARIEAPGNDARFEQANRADARAEAKDERKAEAEAAKDERQAEAEERLGEDVAQEARANARAELEQPANTAVELRLYSDGDTAGGIQSIAASAEAAAATDGPGAEATAAAIVTDPTNTFVSLRVNSAGTTGEVEQDTLAEEIESVNGTTVSRVEEDADDLLWTSTDPASGLEIAFAADGTNTDLRIALDDASLTRPSDGTLFIWTWDMVFGPGGELACAIASSAQNGQIAWNFDCDPEDQIDRASGPAAPTPVIGTISWTWSWLRPDLPGWFWQRNDLIPIPTCSLGCTYVLDFRWISYQPVARAAAVPVAAAPATAATQPAIQQVNDAAATALASATSDAVQIVSQTRDETSAAEQIVLQQLHVEQVASAHAVATLSNALNTSVDTAGLASQANRAAARAEAKVASTIVQQIAQHAAGEDSFQAQAALQLTTTTQVLSSVGIATIVKSVNSGISVGGTSTQTTTSVASAGGTETSTARQTVEQEQEGSSSEQDQVAGQWAEVSQALELVAAARLVDARNESRLREESSSLQLDVDAESDGSARSAVSQLSIQLQAGDTGLQQQESLQLAVVEQSGTALANATGGAFRQLYFTPPPAVRAVVSAPPATEVASAPAAAAAPTETAAPAELAEAPALMVSSVAAPIAAPGRVKRPALTISIPKQTAAPRARPETDVPLLRRARAMPELPAALAVPLLTKVLASPAGVAGSVPRMTEDAEKAAAGSSAPPCLAPISGAAAATGGTGNGSALVAPSGSASIPVPRLGRRQLEPAGRRPAAVVLLRARPG